MQVVPRRQRKALSRTRRDVEDELVLVPCAVETGIDVERAPLDLAEENVVVAGE